MSATASGGIGDSAAWKLIDRLRQSSHRFRTVPLAADTGSTRTHELRTALGHLDVQIRTTFTILQLQLLLHLEEELPDDESRSSFESDSESSDESSTDSDEDASSVSGVASVESHKLAPAQPGIDTTYYSAPPLSSQALLLLQRLCSLLEARVNRALVPAQLGPPSKATSYPRLARLVQYVQSLPPSAECLELIPTPGSAPTPFLFNVSEAADTAAAFDALRDPKQPRPHKKTRQLMLADVELMRNRFLEFNSFVNNLQISIKSLDSLAEQPGQSSLASSRSFASFAALQKFRRQASAAFRAIFSQFGLCPQRDSKEHKIFLQLPEWEDVSDCQPTETTRDLPVQLFFVSCLRSDWQLANAYLLQSEHAKSCKEQTLCMALRSANDDDRDLEFYVPETSEPTVLGEIPVHVPEDRTSGRRHDDSFKFPADSSWTLIKDGYFARNLGPEVLAADYNASVFGIDQRKALAIKLVLGLMLSLDSDCIIGTWNLKRIHSFKPHDKKSEVFVSISENKGTSIGPQGLSLAKWSISRDRRANDDDLQPLPPFTRLAKALLQIAFGDRIRHLKIACNSEGAFRTGWKAHRKLVEACMRKVTSGDGIDREVLPFLHAAQNCLDFHMLYQKHAMTARSRERVEIAWKVAFTDILSQIDSSLTLGGLVRPGTSNLTDGDPVPVASQIVAEEFSVVALRNPAETPSDATAIVETLKEEFPIRSVDSFNEIVLFDGEDVVEGSKEIERAKDFFQLLENFHESYIRFVDKRVAESGVESPRRIRIAVLDTGIDFGHPGIQEAKGSGRIKKEWCRSWVGPEDNIGDEDDGLHGTNCAHILHKAAPEADIYVEKVFHGPCFRSYQAQNIAKAIEHAVTTWNVDIISMSFGLRRPPPRPDADEVKERKDLQDFEDLVDNIQDAIRDASIKAPRIMFAAASNSGKNEKRAFPARYDPWVICVHASDGKGNDGGINPAAESGANFMTLGTGLELLERCWEGEGKARKVRYKVVYKSGTSFATPIAAGVAATVLDLAGRVSTIEERTRKKLKRCEEMRKVLRLMSTPKHDFGDQYCFLAPWNHWEEHWQANEAKSRTAWDSINLLFGA